MSEPQETRHLHIRGALGRARTEMWNGREHLVIPVIALQEGVIHAVNAETPEFVPESVLAESFLQWNGHPIVVGHPVRDGKQCSAHDADLLQQHGFGLIRMAHMNGKRLGMEVLADPLRLEALGQTQLLSDLRAGNPIEVSVGVYARTAAKDGEHNGKKYKAEWLQIVPDHLAFLPGGRGACSLEMGCGAHRAASHAVTEDAIEVLLTYEEKPETFSSELLALAMKYKDCESCKGTGSKDGNPCETCDGEGHLKVAAGARHSSSDRDMIQTMHDHSVKLGATCSHDNWKTAEAEAAAKEAEALKVAAEAAAEADRILTEKAAAGEAAFKAACGCQKEEAMTPELKAEIIRQLVADKHSGFTAGDEKMLEGASDERLESFKVAAESRSQTEKELRAAAEKKLTPEEFMVAAPPELKALIDRQQKQETETKAALVTELKAAQSEYSEAELSVKTVEELTRMARLAKVNVAAIDYSGRGIPVQRAAGSADEDYTPPNPYEAGVKVLASRLN